MGPQVSYRISVEDETDVTPEGSFASGDDEADRKLCEDIHRKVARGDAWAWCMVTVTAEVTIDGETFTGCDHLGGCSYDSEADFREPGGYFDDMCQQAFDDLTASLESARRRGDVVKRARLTPPERRPVPGRA